MRNAFVNELTAVTSRHPELVLLAGDLGFGALDGFRERYPTQFENAGISEQNMTSMAAGMALEGKKVVTWSIGNFPGIRSLEQVRNDVCYHMADVKIVSIGAGMGYGSAGMSHHTTEDIAIMRAMPGMTIFTPADPEEAAFAARAAIEINGPCYIRLGKGGEPRLHEGQPEFMVGKAVPILEGNDVCIFATGAIASDGKKAAVLLAEKGVSAALWSFPTVKPLDKETILLCAEKYPLIVTIEEHTVLGGFGGAVAEILAQSGKNRAVLKIIGLEDCLASVVGSQDYLKKYYGLSAEKIYEKTLETLAIARRERKV